MNTAGRPCTSISTIVIFLLSYTVAADPNEKQQAALIKNAMSEVLLLAIARDGNGGKRAPSLNSPELQATHPTEIVVRQLLINKKSQDLDAFIKKVRNINTLAARKLAATTLELKRLYAVPDREFLTVASKLVLPHLLQPNAPDDVTSRRQAIARAYIAMRAAGFGKRKVDITPLIMGAFRALEMSNQLPAACDVVKDWAIILANNSSNRELEAFLYSVLKSTFTQGECNQILNSDWDSLRRRQTKLNYKMMVLEKIAERLGAAPTFTFPIVRTFGPYLMRAGRLITVIDKGIPRPVTWNWLKTTDMAADWDKFRIYGDHGRTLLQSLLSRGYHYVNRNKILDELKKTKRRTFGIDFIHIYLEVKTQDAFVAYCNLCGKYLSKIESSSDRKVAELMEYILDVKSRTRSIDQTKLTPEGMRFFRHCAKLEGHRELARCRHFLTLKPDVMWGEWLVCKRLREILPVALEQDINTAMAVLDHGVLLIRAARKRSPRPQKNDPLSNVWTWSPNQERIRKNPRWPLFLWDAGTKHGSTRTLFLAQSAIWSQFYEIRNRKLKDLQRESPKMHFKDARGQSFLAAVQEVSAGIPARCLFSANCVSQHILHPDHTSYQKAYEWVRENESKSQFIKQVRFYLELARQRGDEKNPTKLTEEMKAFYLRLLSDDKYSPGARLSLYLFTAKNNNSDWPPPVDIYDLAPLAIQSFLQCSSQELADWEINQLAHDLGRSTMNEEWKDAAVRFTESVKGRYKRYDLKNHDLRGYVLLFTKLLFQLEKNAEANSLLEHKDFLSDDRSFITGLESKGGMEWCARHIRSMADWKRRYKYGHRGPFTIDHRKAADKVIKSIEDPGLRTFAAVYYSSFGMRRREEGQLIWGCQRDRLVKLTKPMSELKPDMLESSFHFLPDIYLQRAEKDLAPIILRIASPKPEELWSRYGEGSKGAQRLLVYQIRALAVSNRIEEAMDMVQSIGNSPTKIVAYHLPILTRKLAYVIAQEARSNGLPPDSEAKDWWRLSESIATLATKCGKSRPYILRTIAPLGIASAYHAEGKRGVQRLLGGSMGGFLGNATTKLDGRELAVFYFRVHPVSDARIPDENRRYLGGLAALLSHSAIKGSINYSPRLKRQNTWKEQIRRYDDWLLSTAKWYSERPGKTGDARTILDYLHIHASDGRIRTASKSFLDSLKK